MATASQATNQRPSSGIKLPCTTCAKPIGIVRCEGRLKLFCRTDLNEHRNQLSKQLEEITVEHDLFQQTLNQSTADPRTHVLISRINAWEKESKNKIKQAAEEAQEATENFIAKILVKDLETLGKKFEQVAGYPGINEGGLAFQNNTSNNGSLLNSQVRCKGEYSGGIHNIRLKIEQYANGLMFFGVNSKSAPLNVNNLTVASSYGWTAGANNTVYKSGQALINNNDYVSDYQTNDIVELELDCYRRHIHMRNHRSNKQYELQIELEKCPFPWMFHFGFSMSGDRLRIVD
ncbi:unnamed protein product [Rotaria magnacalcarata]|uniref:Uncharacterized protein n=1 Tax=Rotaria magnacalcarata TaxID=392030 RepID=A0A816VDK7_9BILA|nr:unnamed protein product [Rotaria magnacalcarata]